MTWTRCELSHPESLSGLIERVTFWTEDTGFAVIKAKVKGHRDLVTVVGFGQGQDAGQRFRPEAQDFALSSSTWAAKFRA